jgi:hypothetical protein
MSEPQSLTLPLRSADTAASQLSNATTNINQGAGTQNNYTQAGGHDNNQYNAENQTFYYHGAPPSQGTLHVGCVDIRQMLTTVVNSEKALASPSTGGQLLCWL